MSLYLDEAKIFKAIEQSFMNQIEVTLKLYNTYNAQYFGFMGDKGVHSSDFGIPYVNDPGVLVNESNRCGYCGHLTPLSQCHFCGGPR